MQKLNDEYERSFMVVMKGYLEVAGLGVNIMHGVNIPWCAIIRHLVLDRGATLEQNENNVTTQTCKKIRAASPAGIPRLADKHVKAQQIEYVTNPPCRPAARRRKRIGGGCRRNGVVR